jgi:hypothetical protein
MEAECRLGRQVLLGPLLVMVVVEREGRFVGVVAGVEEVVVGRAEG